MVARQMGLQGAAAAGYTTSLRQLSWVANVSCTGSEARLTDCKHENVTRAACAEGYATVKFTPVEGGRGKAWAGRGAYECATSCINSCFPQSLPDAGFSRPSSTGGMPMVPLRLTGDSKCNSGRVEVFRGDMWGQVGPSKQGRCISCAAQPASEARAVCSWPATGCRHVHHH